MACGACPLFRGDLLLCKSAAAFFRSWLFVRSGVKPVRRYYLCVANRVACLAWVWWIPDQTGRHRPMPPRYRWLKPCLQKRLRIVSVCRGKPLGCSFPEIPAGLQCGLSGNSVPPMATRRIGLERETADLATFRQPYGKSY